MSLKVGSIVDGTVVNITNFGAFVELAGGKTGLVHISEVSDTFVKDIRDFLKERERVKVKIISIEDNGKVSLSIKQARDELHKKSARPVDIDWSQDKGRTASMSFEERLSKFLKDSEEKYQDLKKNQEGKRGGGYTRRGSAF
ncbi:MAG: S1 domain-containing RNA-binding protein [Clostridiales bacterium]|nr:S1 domain-containing RNA-binding protein [Clostridiales bacterium]